MLGATTASPLATARIAESRSAGWASLSRKPLAPGAQRGVGVLVEVEGGEDEHARARRRAATMRRGGLDAVHAGHAHVHQDDVGPQPAAQRDGLAPSAASPTSSRSGWASRTSRKPMRSSG